MPETDRFDCKICGRSNNADDMVLCPNCEAWFHQTCEGVDERVALDDNWRCKSCTESMGASAIVTTSASPGANATVIKTTTGLSDVGQVIVNRNLQWVQYHKDRMEKEMEKHFQQELARKRAELEKITASARQEIIAKAQAEERNDIVEQSEVQVAGQPVGWMEQLVGKMRDVSMAQPDMVAATSTSSQPAFSSSSTPKTSGATPFTLMDLTLPPSPPPVNGGSLGLPPAIPPGLPCLPPASVPNLAPPVFNPYLGGLFGNTPAVTGIAPTQTVSACSLAPSALPTSLYGGGTLNTGVSWPASSMFHPFGYPGIWPANSSGIPHPGSHVPPSFPLHGTVPAASGSGGAFPAQDPFTEFQRLFGASTQPRTRDQLIARQVMPKDLPEFRGDPDDWPLFFSALVNSTRACGYSCDENMGRLAKALKGKALAAVKSRLYLPQWVPQVLYTLYERFGRPEVVLQSLLNKVDEFPSLRSNDFEGLLELGTLAETICDHIVATGQTAHLCNPDLMRKLGGKLPEALLIDWGICKRQLPASDLRSFTAYMSRISAAALEIRVTTVEKAKPSKATKVERGKEKNFLNAHVESESQRKETPIKEKSTPTKSPTVVCLACNGANHKVKECASFKKWDVEKRLKTVEEQHLCRTCLGKHGRWPCKSSVKCGVDGCELLHHQLLHEPVQKAATSSKQESKPTASVKKEGVNAHHAVEHSTSFRILPVSLFWKGKSVDTYAFLDDGSSITLLDQALADQLGIDDGEHMPLCLTWTGNVTRREPTSHQVSIEVAGFGEDERYELFNTRTVTSMELPRQTLDYEELAVRYPHLQGLPVEGYHDVSPGILIGSNNVSVINPSESREGPYNEPVAFKTRLGWSIYGGTPDPKKAKYSFHVYESTSDEELHELVKKHFTLESVGVSAEKGPESEEDKRARQILEQTTKRVAKGFETGLLWKYDQVKLPNSFPMAMKRWECFERRMKADPELRESVRSQMTEYFANGYIHEATQEELDAADPDRMWYLPLGAVRNPKKPGKIRLVWDAAAKVGGVSLNSMLLKGPDMLIPLPAVLCGFREYMVAVCGDLKQMFHQFKIRLEDTYSQCFIYREDPSQPVKVLVMDVGSFGATCSPSHAQHIKNRNAREHEAEFPRAAKAIIQKHYVDDYLDSFDTEEEAIKVSNEVKEVHSRGGFEIRNWHSNSDELLRRVGEPKEQQSKVVSLDAESDAERVLGLLWLPGEDVLMFATSLEMDELSPTKRNILRCVMSLFDSQGILSHITVQGRMIIQDTWRTLIGWDEEVKDAVQLRWRRWTSLFEKVSRMRLSRAYFPGCSAAEIGTVELHIFTDASEEAYACTAYFRAMINGRVHCTLVMAKAKVAPLKSLSVPRLELMAALLGARLAKTVREFHSYPIGRCIFWTDSAVTLAWIQSEHRRYRQFVAFRVGEILSKTEAKQWRWVPTQHNVADEATKWGKGPSTDVNSRWFKGPDFLYQPESEWPKKATSIPMETDEELRPCLVHRCPPIEELIQYERFSKWERLQRTVGWIHRFVDNCRRRMQKKENVRGCLKQNELAKAENTLWRAVQATTYPDEVAVLTSKKSSAKKQISSSSKLFKLSPYMDEHNVIRIDSRIGAAIGVTLDFKYPIILPREHRVTTLVIDWYHRQFLHANNETVCNEIRQRFHISKLRPLVRKISKECQFCKITKVQPLTPREAPLPEARLAATIRPFSYVGLDFFGPILVRVGRSLVKRWVALFTCLTVRAVHLEVVYTLSTQSCKMAIRRFVARRGAPLEIYSDNGTNFQGASRELREEIAAMEKSLEETFTNYQTKWIFNPPSAPHFGGSWERMVRSVKVAMASMSSSRNPDDETFLTVVTEAESIVNSRPLTYIPLEDDNQEALTPNHFILLSSKGIKQPPREIREPMKAVRKDYEVARQLLDQFWKRWVREYLPTLTKRTKWFKETEPAKVGDLVMIVEDGQRNGWRRGRIVSTIPGRDGRVRKAEVETAMGKVIRRPVSKLAILEVEVCGNAKEVAACSALRGERVDETGLTANAPTSGDSEKHPEKLSHLARPHPKP